MADETQGGGTRFKPNGSHGSTPRPAGKRFKSPDGAAHGAASPASVSHARGGAHGAHGAHRAPERAATHRPAVTTRVSEGAAPRPIQTRSARRSARRARRRPVAIVAVVLAVIVALGLLGFGGYQVYQRFFVQEEEEETIEAGIEVIVTIEEGSTGDQIASVLAQNDVIPDVTDYYAAVTELGAETSLQPGVYLFYTLQDPLEVVKQLTLGSNVDGYTLTVPEGMTVAQTAATVEATFGISADEFIAQATVSNYIDDYAFLADAADDSLEGYLCPRTYIFTETPTADAVIRKMLDAHETYVESLDFETARAAIAEAYGVEMSDYDFLILASIVEREALTSDQRYNIASVFYNRLSIGMALQSDATMGYVTGGEVTTADLATESAYNTYLNTGLTPTPICTPSQESIEAVLDPNSTDYLYFYITTETEAFSETYEEHLAAIEADS